MSWTGGDRQEDIFLQGFVWALGRAQVPTSIIGQSRTLKRHLDHLEFDPYDAHRSGGHAGAKK
jgi:hypothetical protein